MLCCNGLLLDRASNALEYAAEILCRFGTELTIK